MVSNMSQLLRDFSKHWKIQEVFFFWGVFPMEKGVDAFPMFVLLEMNRPLTLTLFGKNHAPLEMMQNF